MVLCGPCEEGHGGHGWLVGMAGLRGRTVVGSWPFLRPPRRLLPPPLVCGDRIGWAFLGLPGLRACAVGSPAFRQCFARDAVYLKHEG